MDTFKFKLSYSLLAALAIIGATGCADDGADSSASAIADPDQAFGKSDGLYQTQINFHPSKTVSNDFTAFTETSTFNVTTKFPSNDAATYLYSVDVTGPIHLIQPAGGKFKISGVCTNRADMTEVGLSVWHRAAGGGDGDWKLVRFDPSQATNGNAYVEDSPPLISSTIQYDRSTTFLEFFQQMTVDATAGTISDYLGEVYSSLAVRWVGGAATAYPIGANDEIGVMMVPLERFWKNLRGDYNYTLTFSPM